MTKTEPPHPVSCMHYVDLERKPLQPLDNPFGPRLLPMS